NQGATVASTYDARNLLTGLTWTVDSGSPSVRAAMTYNVAGERTRLDRYLDPGVGPLAVVSADAAFDAAGQLTDLSYLDPNGNPLVQYHYTRDLAGQLTSETHHGRTSTYSYDLDGQLITADHTGQADEGYGYDANGNRTGGGYVVGANNQILSDG